MPYVSTDPSTDETIAEYPDATDGDIERTLATAGAVHLPALADRIAAMRSIASDFRRRRQELAEIAASEMGKPIAQGLGEVDLVADIWHWYAARPELLDDRPLPTDWAGRKARMQLRPIGPLLGVMPWNFPYYQVARLAAPNLLLGNPIIVKHAPTCGGAATAMQEIADATDLPLGMYQTVFATNEQVAVMIEDERLAGVSLTGSERAGSAVAEIAGRALKRCVLELGGSDPLIVLAADDLEAAAEIAVASRTSNAGQACTSAKRILVHEQIHDVFVDLLSKKMAALVVGSPFDANVAVGPLSSAAAADGLRGQLDAAEAEGARLVGGERLAGPGAFVRPGILTGVTPDMEVWRQELFGPVAIVAPVRDAPHAVEVANDSPFGLGANVFDTDPDRARWVADRLDAGMVSIGAFGATRPELPFGGTKRSGFGRELGPDAVLEFANRRLLTEPA